MRSTSSNVWITVLGVAAAFVAGLGASHVTERNAQAQSPNTATLYVPPGGLFFRAPDGTVLARLSRDAHGGTFELFDDRSRVSTGVPGAASNATSPTPSAYELDDDPWTRPAAPKDDVFKDRF